MTIKIGDLVDRLRGNYPMGPIMENGEPEFGWRKFEHSPICTEAADEIERLRSLVEFNDAIIEHLISEISRYEEYTS